MRPGKRPPPDFSISSESASREPFALATPMPPLTGSFNSSGSPVIKIAVYGVFEQSKQEFEAIVDTGFSGFLSMPIVQAFPLGLVLTGTTTTILADGSQSFKLTALGKVVLGDKTEIGLILLNTGSSDILIGMEFLKIFQITLMISSEGFVLLENEELKKVVRAEPEKQQAQGSPSPSPPDPKATQI